ncbi:MAG: M20 family metallopeptidase [Bdellovibrionales bacterium]|nr:M20 family metallopeptidase [Bdellovibrionales bacterium]
MDCVELCRKLAAIDSSTTHGTKDIVAFVAELSQSFGLTCEVQNEEYNGVAHANIIIRNTSAPSAKEFLLIAHLDTPDPGDYAHWVRTGANPFNVSVDGEDMYGLGLSDAKADFACKLLALKATNGLSYKNMNPVLVGTFGQSSGAGAIRLIRKKCVKADAALVGAPTQLRIATKGPGYAKVEISIPFSADEIKYHEKHNSVEASISQSKIFSRSQTNGDIENIEDNPILRMLDYLKNLPQGISIISVDGGMSSEVDPDTASLEIDIVDGIREGSLMKLVRIGEAIKILSAELKSVHDADCVPAYSTITIGKIRTYPEEIKISGICRLVPGQDRSVYESWLERLRTECSGIGASFSILDYKPPFEFSGESEFTEILKSVASEVGVGVQRVAARKCSEANIFSRLGVATIAFGPGNILKQAHASQEHVRVSDLKMTEEFYKKMIERYCT